MIVSPQNFDKITSLIKNVLTPDIHSCEMFMKWIDYIYSYEEESF
jgi:hypothetical protein